MRPSLLLIMLVITSSPLLNKISLAEDAEESGNSKISAISTPFLITKCSNKIDDDGDGFIDKGGCDCSGRNIDGGAKIDSFIGQTSLLSQVFCLSAQTDAEFEENFGESGYENECPGAGTFYYDDPGCNTALDDWELDLFKITTFPPLLKGPK